MSATFDVTALVAFQGKLRQAPQGMSKALRPVVERAALNVKRDMQLAFQGHKWFGQVGSTVSYDVKASGSGWKAAIGPEKGGAGSLGNLAYFGGSRGGGGTVEDPRNAMEREAPAFEDFLARAAAEVLK